MSWKTTTLSAFLTEREGRIKHEKANKLGLQRIKKIDFSGNIHLDAKTDTKTDMIRIRSGDLVISGINAAKGAIAVYAEDDDVLATIHYSAYEFNPDLISVEFLKWFFKSPEFSDLLREQIPGGIKTELKPKHILPLQVKLPSLAEQMAIADRLNRFRLEHSRLTYELAHQRVLLAKLARAITQDAIQGKLTAEWRASNPAGTSAAERVDQIRTAKRSVVDAKKLRAQKPLPALTKGEIPFEVPSEWVWCRLDDVLTVRSGIAKGGKHYTGPTTLTPYLRVANVQRGYVDLSVIKYLELPASEVAKYALENGDLLVNEGGDPDKVGRCAVWRNEVEGCVHQNHIFSMRPYGSTSLNLEIIPLILNSPYGQGYFLSSYKQTTNLASINKTVLRLTPLPVPPVAEQDEIVKRMGELMTTCRAMEAEMDRTLSAASKVYEAVLRDCFSPASTNL